MAGKYSQGFTTMTAAELIEMLQQCPPNMPVYGQAYGLSLDIVHVGGPLDGRISLELYKQEN